ncbi:MAG: efflux RND transporter periplasmic adaptor subunit [Anaerolineales bacterium]|nr:efflux RND transporter periplasmic adaptor subunit [Anaerolineales bacterium]
MKKVIIIVVILAAIAGGIYGWRQYSTQKSQEDLLAGLQTMKVERGTLISTTGATGTVRSNQTAVLNWQTSGTVERILADIGDRVTSGQELASLELTSLSQSVILAQADLVNVEKDLEDLMNSKLQQAMALQAVESTRQDLDDLLNPELQQALALQAIADAEQDVDLAETRYRNLQSTAGQTDVDVAESQVVITRDALDKAQDKFAPYDAKPEDNLTRAKLQSELAAAQQQYDLAVRNYNGLLSTASDTDLALGDANLAAAKAQLMDAERQYERIKDGPNPADVALLEAQLEDAQNEYERIKDGPDPDDITVAEARIAAAQATLNQIHITAPFDGILTMRENKIGDQVAPGTSAFRIDDLSSLLVDLEVSEVDINRIQEGQSVSLTFDAILGKEYHGEVIEVALVGTEIEGIVNFTVTLELADADDDVRPGMTSAVNIVIDELEIVLLVPNRAVRVVDNQRVVYILSENDQLEAIAITLGASSDINSELLDSDLAVGDLVVLNPPSNFFGSGEMGPPGGGPFGGH